MKISYVGNRRNTASDGLSFNTENHVALTLEKLGHEVNFIQEDEITPGSLPDRVKGSDIFLWTRTWPGIVTLEDLDAIREMGIPTASFHLDKYAGIQRDGGIGTDVFWKTDYVFSPEGSPESKEIFAGHGINQFYLPAGVFEPECYLEEPVDHFKHDVVFVGGGVDYSHPEWPYRAQLVTWLKDTYGDRFGKYGHPERTVRGRELNQLYASCKIVIGDSLCKDFKDSYYWSDRVYETIGRGGFMIHPYIKGLEEEFVDGETIVFYEFGNFEQLKEKIDYYLEHPEEREKIRMAGHEFVKNNATYTQRLKSMLNHIADANKMVSTEVQEPIKINLGSGNDPLEGHINVDMLERNDVDVVHNLMDFPYPFEDGSASHIKAIDVLEHLDNYTDDKKPAIMEFMRECHRILQDGGELYVQTPSWDSDVFKIDITHVRGFHPKSFDFFDKDTWYGQIRGFYDGPEFKVSCKELENGNLQFTMIKR